MTAHQKRPLASTIAQVTRIENAVQSIQPHLRDHVVHAVLSFLLGMHLNENWLKPNGYNGVSNFQWKLAGLFHDIGYPLQVVNAIFKDVIEHINTIKNNIGSTGNLGSTVGVNNLESLENGVNALDLIQQQIKNWHLNIDSNLEYQNSMTSGRLCHGMFSALILLNVIDSMYQIHNPNREYRDIIVTGLDANSNWNQSYFDEDIVPACAAIFVHNLPDRCFAASKLTLTHAQLPYLLTLSDCLQDWERPSQANPNGHPDNLYSVRINNQNLEFEVTISPQRRQEIEAELRGALDDSDIQIVLEAHHFI